MFEHLFWQYINMCATFKKSIFYHQIERWKAWWVVIHSNVQFCNFVIVMNIDNHKKKVISQVESG